MQSISSVNRQKPVLNPLPSPSRAIRILHVVGGMNRGGIETSLVQFLRKMDRDRFHADIMVHVDQPCAYDDEVRQLGSHIIPCLSPAQPLRYAANFRRVLEKYGPYDIIHSHVHHFSGYILKLAHAAKIPIRIAHSHTNITSLLSQNTWRRSLYLKLMKWWINRYATIGFAASEKAAESLFGEHWSTDPRWQVLLCGIDVTPFRHLGDTSTIRTELKLPDDAFVIGHVGRFVEVKNHNFILQIAAQVAQREPKTYLLLVGDGPLRPLIAQEVARQSLSDRVVFAGVRPDIPQLMQGAMDVFLFPSRYEGLGIALVEAQAAGLPCVISDVIPPESDVVKPLVQRVSLTQSAEVWAEAILSQRDIQPQDQDIYPLELVENSPLNIVKCIQKLEATYLDSFNEVQLRMQNPGHISRKL